MYTSAIVIDFGSSNSGAARIDTYKDGRLVYSTPQFCHSDGYYAKDATWFFIHPKLLERAEINYESLHDDDFRILSRVFMNTLEPNIIWGRDLISANYQKIIFKFIFPNTQKNLESSHFHRKFKVFR